MEALLHEIAHYVALVVEAIAILIIAIGSIEALVNIFRALSRASGMQKRAVWLEFAGWLVAALTFQLAADIVNTSLSLIGFGFTIFQVFQRAHEAQILRSSEAPRHFGEALVWLGLAMLIVGIVYHVMFMLGLRREREMQKADGLVHAESGYPVSF